MKIVTVFTELVATAPNGALVDVEFTYTSADPFAVHLRLGRPMGPVWTFARDLLALGLLSGDGDGDVAIIPMGDGTVRFTLYPGGPQETVLAFDHAEMLDALDMTLDIVSYGNEVMDFDAELKKLVDHD